MCMTMQLDQSRTLADFTFVDRYAQFLPQKKRREVWSEAVSRVKNCFQDYYREKGILEAVQPYIDDAIAGMSEKEALPSQRMLQFGGPAALKINARAYNCWFSHCDRPRFFQECIWILLCGGGTGFSAQKHHIARLPNIALPSKGERTYVIPDSIEGWADSIGVLMSSFFTSDQPFPEYSGYTVKFDYSQIRPKGSPFSHGVGVAPGPDGLRMTHLRIINLLQNCAAIRNKLRPIDAYDTVMHCADAVLSGGVRRSATTCLFSFDDEDMLNAKTGNWFVDNPQRGRSNNSAVILRDSITFEQFQHLITIGQQSELGFFFTHCLEWGSNPCFEILLYCLSDTGLTGWQACNLSTQNGAKIHTADDLYRTSRRAAIFGTLQAGMDTFAYLGPVTESIIRREALIGVSMTGMFTNAEIMYDPAIQRKAAQVIKDTNKKLAKIIGINPAARTTAIKPEGTSTTVLGLVAFAGCHAGKGKKVLRRVQCNELSDILGFYKKHNPHAIERSVWGATGTDENAIFYCESPEGSVQEDDITPIEFLEKIRSTQINYINEGTNVELCVDPRMRNNVSNTVTVGDGEWEDVTRYIYDHRQDFTAVSLIPKTGFRDFVQAPFITVFDRGELESMYGVGCIESIDGGVNLLGHGEDFHWLNRINHSSLWQLLNNFKYHGEAVQALCEATDKELVALAKHAKLLKVDTAVFEHFTKYHQYYLNVADVLTNFRKGELNLADKLNMLKDIHTYLFTRNLLKSHRDVDFAEMVELENHTVGVDMIACGGGACTL